MAELGLAEAVEALRAALIDAVGRGADAGMRFGLAPVELTLQAVVTKGADGKIGWWVLGAGGKYESAVTHTVKLVLTPTLRNADGSYTTQFSIADDLPSGATFGNKSQS